jgi:hypothetical protein
MLIHSGTWAMYIWISGLMMRSQYTNMIKFTAAAAMRACDIVSYKPWRSGKGFSSSSCTIHLYFDGAPWSLVQYLQVWAWGTIDCIAEIVKDQLVHRPIDNCNVKLQAELFEERLFVSWVNAWDQSWSWNYSVVVCAVINRQGAAAAAAGRCGSSASVCSLQL